MSSMTDLCYFKCSWCKSLVRDPKSAIGFTVKEVDYKKWCVCEDCKDKVLSMLSMAQPYDLICFAKRIDQEQGYKLFDSLQELESSFQNVETSFHVFGLLLDGKNPLWCQILRQGNMFRQSDQELDDIEQFVLKREEKDHAFCDEMPCNLIRVGWKGFLHSTNEPKQVALKLCPASVKKPGDMIQQISSFSKENNIQNDCFMVSCDSSLQSFPTIEDLQFFCFPETSKKLYLCQNIQDLKKAYYSPSLAPWLIEDLLPTREFIDALVHRKKLKLSKIEKTKSKLEALEKLKYQLYESKMES